MAFGTKPLMNQPYAENAKGELQVAMRLALGKEVSVRGYFSCFFPVTLSENSFMSRKYVAKCKF